MVRYMNNQSGRSMIEMLGVLAIVGILSAGGIAGYSMAMQSYKTSALSEKIQMVAQQSRVLYDGVYTNTTAQGTAANPAAGSMAGQLIAAGLINDVKNPFGGNVTLLGTASPGTTFTVAAANVPAEACVKLLRANWGNSGVFTSIATSALSGTGTAATFTASATASEAIGACGKNTSTITWTFK